jgi:hypothetical protein
MISQVSDFPIDFNSELEELGEVAGVEDLILDGL